MTTIIQHNTTGQYLCATGEWAAEESRALAFDSSVAALGHLLKNGIRDVVHTMLNILVAEDDENDFFLLERAFKRNGAPVCLQRMKDGQEAIEFLAGLESQEGGSHQLWPEICLVDLKMPRANGFDVIRWVRSRPKLKRIVLVVLSASAQAEDINLAYDLGANSYLTKPASLEELTSRTSLIFQYWAGCNERPRWNGHACGEGFSAN